MNLRKVKLSPAIAVHHLRFHTAPELASEHVILKASQGVWERLCLAKHDWVVLEMVCFGVWRLQWLIVLI